MNAAFEKLRVLAMQTPLARLSRTMGETDSPAIRGRHPRRVPELWAFVLDGNRLLIDADELRTWLLAKAEEYHGKGEGYAKFMNAGRVDGYWTAVAEIEQLQRLLASADTHPKGEDAQQASFMGSAVRDSADAPPSPSVPQP